METERLVSPTASPHDLAIERSVRPKRLDEFVGQQVVRELATHVAVRPNEENSFRRSMRHTGWLVLGREAKQ